MENKKNNFKRISENRVSKILSILSQLKNLTNFSYYSYTIDDINIIFELIESEINITKNKLIDAIEKNEKNTKIEL